MSLDEGITEEEIDFFRANDERVFQLVSLAKRECPDGIYPVEVEDFMDVYFNGGGFITKFNEPYCGRYFKHTMECMGQGFSCVDEEDVGVID